MRFRTGTLGPCLSRAAILAAVSATLRHGEPRSIETAKAERMRLPCPEQNGNEVIWADANRPLKGSWIDDAAAQHFEQLVVGPAARTLDDGEAATIAYAVSVGGVPVIDERKATRICSELFPALRMACTVDVLAHPEIQKGLGGPGLADAVFNALHFGRMRVLPHHVAWVVDLIGIDRASLCSSLPHSVRAPSFKAIVDQ